MRDKIIELARKSGGLFFASSIATFFNFLFVFSLARLLGAAEYGYIPLARGSQLFIEAFLELGLAAALIKRISEKPASLEKVVGTSLSLKLLLGLFSSLILIFLSTKLSSPLDLYILAISPFPLFSFAFSNMRSIYSAKMDLFKTSILTILPDALRFFLGLLLFFAGFGVLSGILGFTFSAAVSFAVALLILWRDKLLSFSFDTEEAKRQLAIGLFLNTQQISNYFFPSFVTILCALLLSIADLSVVAVSISFASLIYFFISPLTSFFYPFACQNNQEEGFYRFLSFLLRYWFSFVILSILVVSFAAEFIFSLLGKSFLYGSRVFFLIAIAVFLDSFKSISDYYFSAIDKSKLIVLAEASKFVSFFVILLALLFTGASLSISDIALAILLSFVLSFLIRLFWMYSSTQIELSLIIKSVAIFFVFALIALHIRDVKVGLISLIAAALVLYLSGLITKKDFRYALEIAGIRTFKHGR
ncbi:MAG: lipopolysaccharide biosynthesis protein [Candidatus Anstonellales archaeon]